MKMFLKLILLNKKVNKGRYSIYQDFCFNIIIFIANYDRHLDLLVKHVQQSLLFCDRLTQNNENIYLKNYKEITYLQTNMQTLIYKCTFLFPDIDLDN